MSRLAEIAPGRPRLLHVFPSFAAGGVPIRMAGIVNHWGRRYRHGFIALDGETGAQSRLDARLEATVYSAIANKKRPLATLFNIWRRLRAEPYDLLLTYNWGAIEWALVNNWLLRRPHIHLESGFRPEEADRQIPRRIRLRRLALAGSRALVVPSRSLERIARESWRVPREKLRVIPNGVDCAKFGAIADPFLVPGMSGPPGCPIIGTVAPLRAEKNLARLLRAFALVAAQLPARLSIVGDGPERQSLEELAAKLGIAPRVKFTGHVEQPEKLLGLIDVFAISSDTEQMPNALLQAMAAGRAVASTDVGDCKEMVALENRAFVVPKSWEHGGLAAAILALAREPYRRSEIGRLNRLRAEDVYGQARMFSAYDRLVEDLLKPVEVRAVSQPAALHP